MGCWGPDIWDNDTALDLLGEVTEDDSFGSVIDALERTDNASPGEYVDNSEHWAALAAAEIVACAFGARSADSAEIVCSWLDEHRPALDRETLLLARRAVARAIWDAPSRRKEWTKPESADQWLRNVQQLDRTLATIVVQR